jgi:hypothetical protein
MINGSLNVSLITVWRIFSLPLSSNCRLLYQVSLKEPNAVAPSDDFGLLQPYADDDCREAIYTLCLPVDDCMHCFTSSHTNAILSCDKCACQYKAHFKNRLRGATFTLHYMLHILHNKS